MRFRLLMVFLRTSVRAGRPDIHLNSHTLDYGHLNPGIRIACGCGIFPKVAGNRLNTNLCFLARLFRGINAKATWRRNCYRISADCVRRQPWSAPD